MNRILVVVFLTNLLCSCASSSDPHLSDRDIPVFVEPDPAKDPNNNFGFEGMDNRSAFQERYEYYIHQGCLKGEARSRAAGDLGMRLH